MDIHISRDGKPLGTWSESEVRQFFSEGRIAETDLYWKEGMDEWNPVTKLFPPTESTVSSSSVSIPNTNASSSVSVPLTPASPANFVLEEASLRGIGRLQFLAVGLGIIAVGWILKYFIRTENQIFVDLGITFLLLWPLAARIINFGRSGWWALLYIISPIQIFLFIFCAVMPPRSAPQANQMRPPGIWNATLAQNILGVMFRSIMTALRSMK